MIITRGTSLEGNYALYAKPNSRDKVSLNDIHYIFITQKEILDKSELYSQYIGIQKFIVQFNHSLIDNEIKSFTIQNGGNTKVQMPRLTMRI